MTASPFSAFNTVVLDDRGGLSALRVEAATADQARQIAGRNGQTVLECTQIENDARRGAGRVFRFSRNKARPDTVSFSQDLATLLEAGVTVKDATEALARKENFAARRQIFNELGDSMNSGLGLSAALERTKAFPPLLVATVAASEQTGDLATGLSRYASHQQSLRTVRDKVIGACVYPLLLLLVGSVVVLMLLGVVVPRFSRLIESQGRELPVMSRLLMAWGQFVDANPAVPLIMLGAFVVAVVTLLIKWNDADARRKWLQRIPGVAGVVREFQHLQMYRTTAILTSRGITIHKALLFTADLLSPTDRERLQSGLTRMREGEMVSNALSQVGLSDVVATSMLAVAERSGTLPEMLDRIADFYERSLQRNIDITSRLIEPLLMIVFGLLIGGIVVLMYLPIFDLASSFS
ncbi:MAG: gspF [Ramlibacter sp.]|nr:gspF [Ramlibacter sp.]